VRPQQGVLVEELLAFFKQLLAFLQHGTLTGADSLQSPCWGLHACLSASHALADAHQWGGGAAAVPNGLADVADAHQRGAGVVSKKDSTDMCRICEWGTPRNDIMVDGQLASFVRNEAAACVNRLDAKGERVEPHERKPPVQAWIRDAAALEEVARMLGVPLALFESWKLRYCGR
jgi:hypothetical protein